MRSVLMSVVRLESRVGGRGGAAAGARALAPGRGAPPRRHPAWSAKCSSCHGRQRYGRDRSVDPDLRALPHQRRPHRRHAHENAAASGRAGDRRRARGGDGGHARARHEPVDRDVRVHRRGRATEARVAFRAPCRRRAAVAPAPAPAGPVSLPIRLEPRAIPPAAAAAVGAAVASAVAPRRRSRLQTADRSPARLSASATPMPPFWLTASSTCSRARAIPTAKSRVRPRPIGKATPAATRAIATARSIRSTPPTCRSSAPHGSRRSRNRAANRHRWSSTASCTSPAGMTSTALGATTGRQLWSHGEPHTLDARRRGRRRQSRPGHLGRSCHHDDRSRAPDRAQPFHGTEGVGRGDGQLQGRLRRHRRAARRGRPRGARHFRRR